MIKEHRGITLEKMSKEWYSIYRGQQLYKQINIHWQIMYLSKWV